jgi:putative phosphoesterase
MTIVEEPDAILHMGDSEGAFKILADLVRLDWPDCKLYDVRGNCDIDIKLPEILTVSLAGKRFHMMHGHQFREIKNAGVYDRAVMQTKQNNADVLLCGHTHYQMCRTIDGLLVINPGAAKQEQYAVVEIEDNGEIIVRLE